MKNIYKLFHLILGVGLLASCSGSVKYKSGDDTLSYLKGQEKVKLEFNYTESTIDEFSSEKEYTDTLIAKRNSKKPGSGDKWKKKWEEDKKTFALEFETGLKNSIKKKRRKKGIDTIFSEKVRNENFKVVVHITHIDLGYNYGISAKHAKVKARFEIYSVKNSTSPITVYEAEAKGTTAYSIASRVGEAFDRMASGFGKHLLKKI